MDKQKAWALNKRILNFMGIQEEPYDDEIMDGTIFVRNEPLAWNWAEDLRDAMELVRGNGIDVVTINAVIDCDWDVTLIKSEPGYDHTYSASGLDLPEAICRAFLKFVAANPAATDS